MEVFVCLVKEEVFANKINYKLIRHQSTYFQILSDTCRKEFAKIFEKIEQEKARN